MKKTTTDINTLMNQLIEALPGFVPLDTDEPAVTASMRYGLAKSFANEGFRKYLEMAIRNANNDFDKAESELGVTVVKVKKLLLKDLYQKGKTCFEEAQKLDKNFR